MKEKSKLKRITSFLAICASVVSACVCVLFISGDYHAAHFKMDTYNRELRGWEACRQTNPAYYKANEQAVNNCISGINEARKNFWVKIPKTQWTGILILAGLASACTGYFATWLVICLVGFVIYKLVRLLTFPFRYNTKRHRNKTKRQVQNKNNLQSTAKKREKIPLMNKKVNANPGTKPISAEVRKPAHSAQSIPSNSPGQALSDIEGTETIISDRKEKQKIFQKT